MTKNNNHSFWKNETLAFWLLSFAALAFYTANFVTTFLSSNFGADLGQSFAAIAEQVAPFRFLLVVAAVSLILPPRLTTRGYLYIASASATIASVALNIDEIYLFEDSSISNLNAAFTVLTGLFCIMSLPKVDLWKKVITGLFLGILLGFDLARFETAYMAEYIKLFGTLFIDMIMMIVTPLIFFSLISGVNSISDTNALGRVGKKALFTFLFTSMFAVTIGITIGTWFEPGVGLDLSGLKGASGAGAFELPALLKTILGIVPSNAMGAMAGTEIVKFGLIPNASAEAAELKHLLGEITVSLKPDTLKTVFFAIFVAITLVVMGEKGKNITNFCHDAAQLMFKMIGFIINLAPLAVFGLMAWVSATLGIEALLQLGKLVLATITGMGAQYVFLVLCFIFILRLNPVPFMQKSLEYQMLAFSTSSSKATLATSMNVAERKLGISKPINSFILPLGAAVNMDGTAIYLGIAAIFFAQAYGIDLHFYQYVMIVFTSTIAAAGAAGYPGGSLIVMTLVLTSIGVPTEGIALLVGVDRILDMFRTTINITSDVAITAFIDRSEGSFNEKLYYTPNDQIHDEVIAMPKNIAAKPAAKKAVKAVDKKPVKKTKK